MAKARVRSYFGYDKVPGTIFIGTTPSQIVNTVNYYRNERGQDIAMPAKGEIIRLDEINITACFPLAKVDHNIEARVKPNVIFWVNANAFDYVQQVAANYEELKRGDLYKFQTLRLFGLFFLPEDIMKAVRKYDWKKHQTQIDEWMGVRKADLQEAERRGILRRID